MTTITINVDSYIYQAAADEWLAKSLPKLGHLGTGSVMSLTTYSTSFGNMAEALDALNLPSWYSWFDYNGSACCVLKDLTGLLLNWLDDVDNAGETYIFLTIEN